MNDFLLWAVALGPALLAEGLLARYEVLAYGAAGGRRSPNSRRGSRTRGAPTRTALRAPISSIWTG
ncbi:hypothetical protein ACFQ2H_40530 [Streptomyces violaceoruber]